MMFLESWDMLHYPLSMYLEFPPLRIYTGGLSLVVLILKNQKQIFFVTGDSIPRPPPPTWIQQLLVVAYYFSPILFILEVHCTIHGSGETTPVISFLCGQFRVWLRNNQNLVLR